MIIPPPFPEINIDHCNGGLHVSIPRSIPSHRSSEVYIHCLFTVVFLRRPAVAFRFGRGSKLDAEWCFAWLMNTNRLAYALSMPLLLSLLISIACDDGCRSYCRFDVGLHEAMMSLGVGKLKDEVICTLARQLTEVAAMAYVLRFATLLSLYVGVLSLPAQRRSSRLWQWDQIAIEEDDEIDGCRGNEW
ncbi:hypothetical protein Tco_0158617 [Tanacetum coccineum]